MTSNYVLGRKDVAREFLAKGRVRVSCYDAPGDPNPRYTWSTQPPEKCKPSVRYRILITRKAKL